MIVDDRGISGPCFHMIAVGCDSSSAIVHDHMKPAFMGAEKSTWILGIIYRCDGVLHQVTDVRFLSLGPSLWDKIEKLVALVYDKSNSTTTLSTARQHIYQEKRFREIPTKPVVLVDNKRQLTVYVVCQASIWVSLTPSQVLSDPKDFGWHMV